MKKLILLITYNVSLIAFCTAQNPLVKQWDKRFGGTYGEILTSFQQTIDGGYILAGWSASDSSGDKTQNTWSGTSDYWIIKTDSLGNKQWDKDFGGTGIDYLFGIQQTADGGYILGGYSNSGISGDKTQDTWGSRDYWIIKTDGLGNKQWDRDFGGTDNDFLSIVQQTTDGGFILGGYSASDSSGDKTQDTQGYFDYWILKTDSLGNKQWDKDFGGTDDDELFSLQQTSDGGYLLGGISNSGIGGDKTQDTIGGYDYWVIKTDSLGNKQWDKDFGGTSSDYLYSLKQTADGSYLLGGISISGIGGHKTQDTIGGWDYWILKTDSLGSKLWDKVYGGILGEDYFGNISQTNDGGYLMAGSSYSPISGNKTENNLGPEQLWIVKTDSLGIQQWDKTIFTTEHDETGLAVQTKDGCYAMANYTLAGIGGYKTQPSWGSGDYWIIKFCDSTSATGIQSAINNPQSAITIYPNPANKLLVISYLLTNEKKAEITVYDLFGRRVLKTEVRSRKSEVGNQKTEMTIDISKLSSGIYFLKAGDEVRKFVKE